MRGPELCPPGDDPLIGAVREVVAMYERGDLSANTAELASYDKRFARLLGPDSKRTIPMEAAMHHFAKDLKEDALQELTKSLGISGEDCLDQAGFVRLATLACEVLRRLQDSLFDAGPLSPLDVPFRSGKGAAQRYDAEAPGSGRGWSIRAGRDPGSASRRPSHGGHHHANNHPTLAELLSRAGLSARGDEASGEGSAGAWQQFQEGSTSDVSSASLDWASPHQEGSSNVLDFFTPILTSSRAVVSRGNNDKVESKQLDFVEETDACQESGWVAFATVSPAKVMAGSAPAGQSISPTKPHPVALSLLEPGSGLHLPVMKMSDRARCERIFEAKDFARKGGLRYGAAWMLFKQTGVRAEDFHEAFVLAGDSVSGLLGQTEFCLLIHLLYCLQGGYSLPPTISSAQGRALLGLGPLDKQEVPKLRLERLQALLVNHEEQDYDDTESDVWTSRQTSPAASSVMGGDISSRIGGTAKKEISRPKIPTASIPRQVIPATHAFLEVSIQLARFVYRKTLDRPFITMSVRDGAGRLLEMPRDSCPGRYSRLADSAVFNHSLQVTTPLKQLPPSGSIFLELRHWKGREGRFSTLAWTTVALERLMDGPSKVRETGAVLPLYKKPVDPSLRRKNRLTSPASIQIQPLGRAELVDI